MSSSTKPFAAAREGDGIEHTASKGWLVVGLIGGAIAGAAFTLVTGGVGTAVLAATLAGAAAGWVKCSAACHGRPPMKPAGWQQAHPTFSSMADRP